MAIRKILQVNIRELFQLFADIIRYTPLEKQYPTVFILGSTGIGKTTICRDMAKILDCPITFCNLAGQEAPDIVGLPTEKDGVVHFAKPWWFDHGEDMNDCFQGSRDKYIEKVKKIFKGIPKERSPQRILNLDEMNRIQPDSFGPAMNIILEGKHQEASMKLRTLIIAAGNLNTDEGDENYSVNEFDPAQRDRLLSVRLVPELKEWKSWAGDTVHPGIISWISKNKEYVKAFNSEKGLVSLRRLTQLGLTLKEAAETGFIDNDTRCRMLISAWVPIQIADAIMLEVKNSADSLEVSDVLNDYDRIRSKVKAKVKKSQLDIIHQICDGIVDFLGDEDQHKNLDEEALGNNLMSFLKDIPRTSTYKVCSALVDSVGRSRLSLNLLHMLCKDETFISICQMAQNENVGKK